MLTLKQKLRFVECIRKKLHDDFLWFWDDTTEEYGNSYYAVIRVGDWYICRTDHSAAGDDYYVEFLKGVEKALAFGEEARDAGFDDDGLLEWVGDPEEVRQLPDCAKDFSNSLTPDQIVEAIQADEHLLLFVHDPHYELPDEYYPPLDKDPD